MKELLEIVERNLEFCKIEKSHGCNYQRLMQLDGMITAYENVIKLIKLIKNGKSI